MTVKPGNAAIGVKLVPGQIVAHTTNATLTNGVVIREEIEHWDQRDEALRTHVDWGSGNKQWHKTSQLTVTG